jgi:hypothetical protein
MSGEAVQAVDETVPAAADAGLSRLAMDDMFPES